MGNAPRPATAPRPLGCGAEGIAELMSGTKQARPLVLLTNTTWVDGAVLNGRSVRVVSLLDATLWQRYLRVLMLWRYDVLLLNIETRLLLLACALKRLLPFLACRIVSVDVILNRPRGARDYPLFLIRRWLIGAVDRIILYYRDTEALRRVYGLREGRVRYVPFKVNTRDQVLGMATSDEGFFLACGRSNRDYASLVQAFRELPHECRILAPWHELGDHGTDTELTDLPPNVKLVSDDGTPKSWNAWIARAHAVILPIVPGMLSPSGIGTYLVAMALGKPVIITRSPATADILNDRTAVLIPPRDPAALKAAVQKVATDDAYRRSVAEAGREYALSLGGEQRLAADVLAEIDDLLRGAGRTRAERDLRARASQGAGPRS